MQESCHCIYNNYKLRFKNGALTTCDCTNCRAARASQLIYADLHVSKLILLRKSRHMCIESKRVINTNFRNPNGNFAGLQKLHTLKLQPKWRIQDAAPEEKTIMSRQRRKASRRSCWPTRNGLLNWRLFSTWTVRSWPQCKVPFKS